jgi:hypothetical protein
MSCCCSTSGGQQQQQQQQQQCKAQKVMVKVREQALTDGPWQSTGRQQYMYHFAQPLATLIRLPSLAGVSQHQHLPETASLQA